MTARSAGKKAGVAAVAPQGEKSFSLISDEKLLEIYTAMVKCRMIAESASRLMRKGLITGDLDKGAGREAAIAGVCVDLAPEDALSASHHDSVAGYLKGVPLHDLFSELAVARKGHRKARLKKNNGEGARTHILPTAATSAEHLALACGVALTQKWRTEGKITVVLCGDGELAPGAWREPLTIAGRRRLPIVFVYQSQPSGETKYEQIAAHAKSCGIPSITVDGWDAVAVYRVAYESIARARQSRGATLIECRADKSDETLRHGGKVVMKARPHDPILNMEAYLKRKRLFDDALHLRIAKEFRRQLSSATKMLKN